jgi:hypothetical protein
VGGRPPRRSPATDGRAARSRHTVAITGRSGGHSRIRICRCVRIPVVGSLSPHQHEWVIRPLIDAGLGLDRIKDLLFRLGFESIVSEGRGTAIQVSTMVESEPPRVQAAWHEVIDRMISMSRSNA